jgi:murein DD-endopeptidase MepM/ murein hydrolase activator NlpD
LAGVFVAASFVVAAVPASARPASVDQAQPEEPAGNHGLQQEYDAVLGEELELQAELDQIVARRDQVGTELARLDADLAQRRSELAAARAALDEAEQLEAQRKAEAAKAQRDVETTEKRLKDQAIAMYVSGDAETDVMEAILQADTIAEASTALTYSQVVVDDTDQLLEDFEDAKVERDRAHRQAEEARRAATTHRDEIETITRLVASARNEQKTLADQLDVERWNESAKLLEIQGRKTEVEARIISMQYASDGVEQLLAAAQADQEDWKPGAMVITTPIPGYHIGSAFGMRHHPILGISRLHADGDIGAPSGTEIHAPADGVVLFAGERGGYGNCVVIDHGNSLGTLYGHQSEIEVEVGDVVQRGDIIGRVGSTGLSTGPHLHFETRLKGVPVDPEGIVDWDAEVDYDAMIAERLRLQQQLDD